MKVEFLDEMLHPMKTLKKYLEEKYPKKLWKHEYDKDYISKTYFDGTPGDWFAVGNDIYISGKGTFLGLEDVISITVLEASETRHRIQAWYSFGFPFAAERKKAGFYKSKKTASPEEQKVMIACAKKIMAKISSIKDSKKAREIINKTSAEDIRRQTDIDLASIQVLPESALQKVDKLENFMNTNFPKKDGWTYSRHTMTIDYLPNIMKGKWGMKKSFRLPDGSPGEWFMTGDVLAISGSWHEGGGKTLCAVYLYYLNKDNKTLVSDYKPFRSNFGLDAWNPDMAKEMSNQLKKIMRKASAMKSTDELERYLGNAFFPKDVV